MDRKKLVRIIVAALLLVPALWVEHFTALPTWKILLIYLVPYLLVGYDVIAEAFEGLMHGEAFNEEMLMVVATVGALCIGFLPESQTQFAEAVFVMFFFQVGELFEDYAEGKSRRAISRLMDIRPDSVNVERGGEVLIVHPETVEKGEIIVIKPGEKIALDGVIVEGVSSLNTTALTGESMPREVKREDEVASGCVNISGVLRVRVEKVFAESTATKIIELVQHASDKKSRSETFVRRFARIYTPIVILAAVLLAFLPPLLSGNFIASFSTWLYRALTFLVVSCPCALVISIPLTFFGGIGGASRHGILVKGASYMDVLAKLRVVVFDKTGTLTRGRFEVCAVHPEKCDETHLLHLAAHVERFSTHPIALSLRAAYPNENDDCSVSDVEEIAGQGVRAVVNGLSVCVGNERMMQALGVEWHPCHKVGTTIHVSIAGEYAGHIVVADMPKPDAAAAIRELKELGISRTVMLTGDRRAVGEHVAKLTGIDEFHAELLPINKVEELETQLAAKPVGGTLAFVGDGINDAPVLARADVGIAMGGLGSDAAIEAADVVLMDDRLPKIALAVRLARRTLAIARQNVVLALSIKLLVLLLAGAGLATMWMAVFADVGVMVLAVLNAMRALRA